MAGAALLLALGLGTACADTTGGTGALEDAGPGEQTAPVVTAADVLSALQRLERRELWPGFRPDTIPLALYDGERTWLAGFRGTAPAGFVALPGTTVLSYDGRHDAVVGNTPTRLEGVPVAAVLLSLAGADPEAAAATAIHEKFHVHQNALHPEWGANELARFAYPVARVEPLFLRRLETRAFDRAAAASSAASASCWLSAATVLRQRRFAILPPEAVEYERALERTEGIARYVEQRALGASALPTMPQGGFPPEDVRARAYLMGQAIASALDMLAPGWQARVEASSRPALDSLLADTLQDSRGGSCGFSAEERGEVDMETRDAIAVMEAKRAAALRDLASAGGWTLRIVTSSSEPFWPRGFDPMNITLLGDGALLHERMLRVGNAAAEIDVFDRSAVTIGAADDPLGRGIGEVRVYGLDERPNLQAQSSGGVRFSAPGVSVAAVDARVEERDSTIVVRLP